MTTRTYDIWVLDEQGRRVRQAVTETVTVDEENAATLRQRATAALDANTTFLALASPTNAQNAAQVRLLTRECSALIRMALNLLDSTDGT